MIPRTPKRFANWLARRPLPPELGTKAVAARDAINLLALNKSNCDFAVIAARYEPTIKAFEDAFTAFEKARQ